MKTIEETKRDIKARKGSHAQHTRLCREFDELAAYNRAGDDAGSLRDEHVNNSTYSSDRIAREELKLMNSRLLISKDSLRNISVSYTGTSDKYDEAMVQMKADHASFVYLPTPSKFKGVVHYLNYVARAFNCVIDTAYNCAMFILFGRQK